ncbi:MAG: PKD domain-containing protein [Cyclobacteriaceae bacterium]|jgi:PKD repeat protein
MRFFITGTCVFVCALVLAQPTAQITLLPKACRLQDAGIQNLSVGASSFRWDFCYGGSQMTPVGSNSTLISPANAPEGLALVEDNGLWFGFMVNTNSNSILRLDFGTTPANNPSVVDLGNIGGFLDRPRDISVIETNGNWFALITCFNVGSGTTRLVRLNFGTLVSNTPTAQNLGNLSGRITQAYSVEWLADQGEWIAVIGDRNQRKLLLVNFGSLPTATPSSAADFKEFVFPGGGFLKDMALLRDSFGWKGIALVENGNVFKLEFLSRLFEVPIAVNITGQVPLTGFPNNVVLLRDVDRFVAFVLQFEGDLFRLDFGKNLNSNTPHVLNLGKLGTLANVQGLAMVKFNNNIYGYSCSVASQLKQIHFSEPCFASVAASVEAVPTVSFSSTGAKIISLQVMDHVGETRFAIDSIFVKSNPTATFSFSRNCATEATLFVDSSVDDGVIQSWAWDFDDPSSGSSNSSTAPNPSHVFSIPGNYQVELTVIDDCGDSDTILLPVSVTDPAGVSLGISPTGPICSFQEVIFSPATPSGIAAVSDAQWSFGDGGQSTNIQPVYQYLSANTFQVQLQARVNQCSKSASVDLIVNSGTNVQFSTSGACSQQPILFTDLSSPPGVSTFWSFGDGQNSVQSNPQHTYSSGGEYSVSLQVVSANGCVNERTVIKSVKSRPAPNFSLALPPFSCAGTPSQFTDLTPPPTDSNITSWSWSFGDPANGTSAQRNPAYTYNASGNYSVGLTTTTNAGCSATVTRVVTISGSPTASFTSGLACAGSPTQFTDTSVGVVSRMWQIQSTSYTTPNPAHVFPANGSFPVTLTVTGANGCLNQRQQIVNVPVPVQPDFISQNLCATQITTFQDASTASPTDPPVLWQWDFGLLGTAQGTSASRTFPAAQSYNVQLSVTSQSGCQYIRSRAVVINPAPVAGFVATPIAGAAPLTVDFTNTSTGATAYQWLFGDPANSQSTDISPGFTYLSLGSYPVRLIASRANGCRDTALVRINVVVPAIDLSVDRLELVLQPDGTRLPQVTLTNRSNVPVKNPDLNLQLGSAQSVVETIMQTLQPGEQLVRFMNSRVGAGQADYVCVSATTINDGEDTNNRQCLSLRDSWFLLPPHPNPAREVLWVQWTLTTTPAELEVWSMTGQRVAHFENLDADGGQTGLDVSGWAPGVYILQLRAQGSVQQARIQVMR